MKRAGTEAQDGFDVTPADRTRFPHDRDDGGVSASAGTRGAEILAGAGRASRDQELLGEEARRSLTDGGELPERGRGPEHIGESGSLVIGEGDRIDRLIGIVDPES